MQCARIGLQNNLLVHQDRYCLWNVETLLFVNFRIESIKESGMNKLKDSIGSATESAAFLGPGLFCRMFLFR